jgi:nitrate reductase beta subunit
MCVTGCPYKKVYFNHRTGKAEKCTLCYPRIEVGLPTVCSETCVGRLRYLGLFLYDADRVTEAAATENEQDLYEAQLDLMLDPNDPKVIEQALRDGIPQDWLEAAKKSPVYALAKKYKVALPLHPEYRTMPMVWYIPPLSPVVDALRETGNDAEDAGNLFGALNALRIPIEYLAELFTAGDVVPVKTLRSPGGHARVHARQQPGQSHRCVDPRCGRDDRGGDVRAVPSAGDRQVRGPLRHSRGAHRDGKEPRGDRLLLGLRGGAGHVRAGSVRRGLRTTRTPVAVETFHALAQRQQSETIVAEDDEAKVNLLNWDGVGVPLGMPSMPPRPSEGEQ